jgi:acyl-coenzyme A thioesterase PaaI-like protein
VPADATPEDPDGATEPDAPARAALARRRLGRVTRRLLDAIATSPDATEAELAAAAGAVEQATIALYGPDGAAGAARTVTGRRHGQYIVTSPLVGDASPVSPPVTWELSEGRVVGRGAFGAAHEGPPGFVHGGWVALAFDELLGITTVASGHAALTARLAVRYRRPTPLREALTLEGWIERHEGRRTVVRGQISVGGEVTAEAEGLFVTLDPERAIEYFGDRAGVPEPTDLDAGDD